MREWSNGMVLLGRLALGVAVAAPFVWVAWRIGGTPGLMLGIVAATPLVVKLVTRHLIELFHEGFTWLSRQPLQEWEGAYYAFDDIQVRIHEFEGELWFTVADILAAIGAKRLPPAFLATHRAELRRIPGSRKDALPARSLPALLEPMREANAGRFLLWARREVVAPWERKHGAARFGGAPKT